MKYSIYTILLFVLIYFPTNRLIANSENDSIPNIIKVWSLNYEDFTIDSLLIDTGIIDLHNQLPLYNQKLPTVWLGNYGLPFQSSTYDININSINPFVENLKEYFLSYRNQKFYNTRKPISKVDYYNSGGTNSKSQILKVMHSQNINPEINAGFRILFNHSLGDYSNQEVKNSSFGVWNSIQKKNYELFAGFNYNKFKIHNNGGFLNDSIFESGTYDDSKYIEVNLSNAKSTVSYYDINVMQSLSLLDNDSTNSKNIFSNLKLIHNAKWIRSARSYEDSDPSVGFYQNVFLDSVLTNDSIATNTLFNSLSLASDENLPFNIQCGVFNNIEDYYSRSFDSTLVYYGVLFNIKYNIGNRIESRLSSRYVINGFYQGNSKTQFNIVGKIFNDSLSPLIGLNFLMDVKNPTVFIEEYYSNNFVWENHFDPMVLRKAQAFISCPDINTLLNVSAGNISKYLYLDDNAIPTQYQTQLSFFSAAFYTNLTLENFNLSSSILYQKTDNEKVMPLPEYSFKGSLSYSNYLFKKALHAGIGLDLSYYSEYYAPSFMPALGMFYNQDDKKIGNYPYLDVYINAKVKSFRLLFKYHHINQGLTSDIYYSAYNYASPPRRFTFGISWMFYD